MSYDPLAPRASGGNRVVKFFVAFIAIAALAGGVGMLYASRHEVGGAPPLIKADPGPTKVVPENPGGMQIPNQNMNVYNNMGGAQPAAKPGTEKLLTPPEQAAPQAARVTPAEPTATVAAPDLHRMAAARNLDVENHRRTPSILACVPQCSPRRDTVTAGAGSLA